MYTTSPNDQHHAEQQMKGDERKRAQADNCTPAIRRYTAWRCADCALLRYCAQAKNVK
jgi:hypothetical protein